MLVTSCRDNICRVWAETIPPEIEGLANMSQFEGSDRHGHHGKHRHHNMHKHRFMQRLKHMKYEEIFYLPSPPFFFKRKKESFF